MSPPGYTGISPPGVYGFLGTWPPPEVVAYGFFFPPFFRTPPADIPGLALAQNPALAECGQPFLVITNADTATVSVAVIVLLSGPTPPRALLVWQDPIWMPPPRGGLSSRRNTHCPSG